MAERLLEDIGETYYQNQKVYGLSIANRKRIAQAISIRFKLRCDLCYQRYGELIKARDEIFCNSNGKGSSQNIYLCSRCESRLMDFIAEEQGLDRENFKDFFKIYSMFQDENSRKMIPKELPVFLGIFRYIDNEINEFRRKEVKK